MLLKHDLERIRYLMDHIWEKKLGALKKLLNIRSKVELLLVLIHTFESNGHFIKMGYIPSFFKYFPPSFWDMC